MPKEAIVIIRDKQWLVWLSTTPEEIVRGLGGVPQIPAGTGMLFDLGAEQVITVTTVPMLFPIDIVFINEGLAVTEVAGSIAPGYLVTSDIPARYFLEVNAGEALGIQAGDQALVQVYQPAAWGQQFDIITPVIDLVAAMVVFALMFGMVRTMSRAALPKPKPKVELYGPRGERLLPRLIGPRERRDLPEELQFFADSSDHIEHSMNHNGLRTKLDTAFQEAILRAKGGK